MFGEVACFVRFRCSLEGASLPSGVIVVVQRVGISLRVGVIVSSGGGVAGRRGIITGRGGAVGRSRGTIAGLRGTIADRRGAIAGGGSATGSEEVKSEEVDSQEGKETEQNGLRNQVNSVTRTGEVKLASALLVVQVYWGGLFGVS